MKWLIRLCLLGAVVFLAAANPAVAQRAGIAGRVTHEQSGRPLEGVTVALPLASRHAVTDSAGRFALLRLAPGSYTITFEMVGYARREYSLVLESDEVAEIDVELPETPIELEGLTVTATRSRVSPWLVSKGFMIRRAQARGLLYMAGSENLWWRGVRSLEDVLSRESGLTLRRAADGSREVLLVPGPGEDRQPCPVVTYLNGMVVQFGVLRRVFRLPSQWGSRRMSVGDLVSLRELDALELYGPAYSPVASNGHCGALLLWSEAITRDVDAPFAGIIRGVVLEDGTQQPVAGARVRVEPVGLAVTTGADGKFTIAAVPAGRYHVSVEVDTASWNTTLELRASSVQELVVVLTRTPSPAAREPLH